MDSINERLAFVGAYFDIKGVFAGGVPYGSGHINDTYSVTYDQAGAKVRYIFQRVNERVFREPEKLMDNIARVTLHLWGKIAEFGADSASRAALRLVDIRDGRPFLKTAGGEYWRVYLFIEGARTYDVMTGAGQAFAAASAFGRFQCLLADLPTPTLHETIPGFHNTPGRLESLLAAAGENAHGRLDAVKDEMDFILARRRTVSYLEDQRRSGTLPERVTHNDTKLNNVMIDDATGEGVCVIDLDTVMPGLVAYDFGDLVRTSASPAPEDERDLSKVDVRMEMIKALAEGYLSAVGGSLSPAEIDSLPRAGEVITLEIGIRFLTDYLRGDVYFKIKREGQNLDRCRVQLKLVELLERLAPEIRRTFQ